LCSVGILNVQVIHWKEFMETAIKVQNIDISYSERGVSVEASTLRAALSSETHTVPVFRSRAEKLKWMREKVAKNKNY